MSVKSILRGLKSTYLDNESVTIKEQLGYAGGILSAAVDGIKTALKIIEKYT